MKKLVSQQGFTLMELMIVVAIVGILAAIALPSYRDYVIRGQLVNATTTLSANRARMEQYYQDNRTYGAVAGLTSPCVASTAGKFDITCASGASTYTITATGKDSAAGFTYSINEKNVQTSVNVPPGWGANGTACWIIKKGATC